MMSLYVSGLGFDFADQQDYTGATILIGKTITEVKLYLKRSATGPGSAINLTGRIYNADFSSYSESTNTISSDTISRSAYTECTFSFTGHVLLTDDVVVCFWSGGTSPGNCEINCLNSGSTSSGYLQGTSGSITSLNTSAGAKYSRAVITYTGGSSGTRLPPPPIVVHI